MSRARELNAAFPATPSNCLAQSGMSLREWFAGQALANTTYVDSDSNAAEVAVFAYQIADEMMKRRIEE